MSLMSQVPTLVGSIGPASSRPSMSITTPQSPRRGHMPATTRPRATTHDSAPAASGSFRAPLMPSASSSAPTVATSPRIVVASSINAPDAAFHQLALAEDILLPKTKIVAAVPGAPTPTPASSMAASAATSGASWQSYPSSAAACSPPAKTTIAATAVKPTSSKQQPAPLPSPPNSEDAASILLQARPRAPSIAGNRNIPCPLMRRSVRPRIRRKPIPRVNASANLRVPTPPPSPAHKPVVEREQDAHNHEHIEPFRTEPSEEPRQQQQQQQTILQRRKLPQQRVQLRRPVVGDEAAARDWLDSSRCTMLPLGVCYGTCAPGAPYCAMHSCHALLADRTMCNGPVPNPHLSRFCVDGYHGENAREDYVTTLVMRRAEYEAGSAERKEREWAERRDYFDREFGEAIASPYAYKPDNQTPPVPLCASSDGLRANYERMWGAHADDKWWVGEWRFHSSSRV